MSVRFKINENKKREYREKGYWGDATLLDYWNMSVLSVPDKIAVIDLQGTSFTYKELDIAASKVAAYLEQIGVEPGDFVSFQIPGWAEFTLLYIACLKAGAVINPICVRYRSKELLYILNKCESKAIFVPAEFKGYNYLPMVESIKSDIPSLKKIVQVEKESVADRGFTLRNILNDYSSEFSANKRKSDDLAAVLFTSGTTGKPKGVMLTHNNIIFSEKMFNATLNINYTDVMLMPAPLNHATGFHHGVTAPFMAGAKSVLQDIFKPDISLELIQREKCTYSMGATPFVYDILQELNKKDYDVSSLRFFLCGGAPIPRRMTEDALKAGFKVLGVYGSTESVPHTNVRPEDSVDKIVNTDGCAAPGIEVKVVDENRNEVPQGIQGEEASRGPNVFVGYLKEPEITANVLDDEGWYYSGDLCKMDEDDYIRITGRKKDIIIRGGENLSCSEIENIILHHPNIMETAVVGMPDPRLGERACAYIVLKDNSKKISLSNLIKFLEKLGIAKHKYPERIEIVDKLPRTESGKVKKYILKKDIEKKVLDCPKKEIDKEK